MKQKAAQGGSALKILVVLVLILLLAAFGYMQLMLHWSYSTGERAGWLQKLSRKGIACKTWEGELSMIAVPGAAPEKFYFTVADDVVAAQINRDMGRRVSLTYEQKIGLPTSCFGDTQYFVTAVQVVDEGNVPPSSPVAPQAPAPTAVAPAAGTPATN